MDLTIPVTGKESAKGFNYGALDNGAAEFAREKAAEIWRRHDRMVDDWMATADAYEEVALRFGVHDKRGAGGKFVAANKTYKEWVEGETPYTASTVQKMRAATKKLRSARVARPRLSPNSADRLTRGDVPQSVIKVVHDRLDRGEVVTQSELTEINRTARKMDREAPLPSPKEATRVARKTSKAQLASDGKIYSGATAVERADHVRRRQQTYGVIDAIERLHKTALTMTPNEWLAAADPEHWWLVDLDDEKTKEAVEWLNALYEVRNA